MTIGDRREMGSFFKQVEELRAVRKPVGNFSETVQLEVEETELGKVPRNVPEVRDPILAQREVRELFQRCQLGRDRADVILSQVAVERDLVSGCKLSVREEDLTVH